MGNDPAMTSVAAPISAQDRPALRCWKGILFCGSLAAEHFSPGAAYDVDHPPPAFADGG
jgi:hypothetical protein